MNSVQPNANQVKQNAPSGKHTNIWCMACAQSPNQLRLILFLTFTKNNAYPLSLLNPCGLNHLACGALSSAKGSPQAALPLTSLQLIAPGYRTAPCLPALAVAIQWFARSAHHHCGLVYSCPSGLPYKPWTGRKYPAVRYP